MVTRLASKSQQLYEKAKELIPGGVNSPVRSYLPYPLFLKSANGCKFRTVDDEEYLDYCMAYGALLDGHVYPETVRAVKIALENGTVFGQPTEQEFLLAKLISDLVPSIQMVRLVNSGTEATMHALRLARGFTGRSKILKFEGGFHGSHDGVLVNAGSGAFALASPDSLGIPQETVKNTLVARYNDADQAKRILRDNAGEVASVILEPVMGNMGPILPEPGFLESLREITEDESIVLIFDEVITGFRLALGGAQEYYGVKPDLTVLGKVLGGGLPLSAFGGKREIMEKLAPLGGVYQAGTYAGNPVSVAAGLATLESLKTRAGQVYPSLESAGKILRSRIAKSAESLGLNVQVNGVGSMFQVFFTDKPVVDYQSAKSSNPDLFRKFFQSLLRSHVFVPPSQFETCFLSTSHTAAQIEDSLAAIGTAFRSTIE
jgi:glutamate-1-semialdehyde 2,1-aminomutase